MAVEYTDPILTVLENIHNDLMNQYPVLNGNLVRLDNGLIYNHPC